MNQKPLPWQCLILFIFILFSCSQNEDLNIIENLSSQTSDLNSLTNKKGSSNTSLNHLKNLEAEMLEEVFCYAARIGGSVYFVVPTSRMQNFGYVNLQPSDIVVGGGGGTPAEFLLNSNSGTISDKRIYNACLKNAIETILHDKNLEYTISYFLEKFRLSSKVNLDFREAATLPGDTLALTTYDGNGNITTTFNLGRLKKASNEVIFTTIYHEVLHAGLLLQLTKEQHNLMVEQYLGNLVAALIKQFPNIKYPDDLALMGLEKTDYFINRLTPNQKSNYFIRRQTYFNGKNGSYCN